MLGHYHQAPTFHLEAKRGDGEHVSLKLLRNGLPWEAPSLAQFRFVVKPQANWAAEAHALADSWTYDATLESYEASINYVVEALNSLLRIGDTTENGSIELMAELAWRPNPSVSWRRSQTVGFRLHNNVWRGVESVPPGTPTEPDSAALFAWNTNALEEDVFNENAVANTLADVGLSVPLAAGQRQRFRFTIFYNAAATSTGSRWGLGLSGAATVTDLVWRMQWNSSASGAEVVHNGSGFALPTGATAGSYLTGNRAIIEGIVTGAVDDSFLTARFASEVAGSRITSLAGSTVDWMNLPSP